MPANLSHIPVLINEVIDALAPIAGKTIIDGTFGAGGYSLAMLEQGANVIAIDRDPNVMVHVERLKAEFGDGFTFVVGEFSKLDELVQVDVDAVVLDIGVSSMQLDEAERGFSFMRNGPLDMRMSSSGETAADIVNNMGERALADLLFAYGEEKRARRIAKAIIESRNEKVFVGTKELADVIENCVGKRAGENHPATKSFQALRIAVNKEFDELVLGLFAAEKKLKVGGVLAVVSFHSLEDRIVKRFFASSKAGGASSRHMPLQNENPTVWESIKKAQKASKNEVEVNPRSRSATLRVAKRTNEIAREVSFANLGVPLSKGMQK